jgi:protein transport protein SEC13
MADHSNLLWTGANEMQHDAVLDYYGRRLATCSSDKTIKIFEVEGEKHTLVETLRGYVTA